jgi:multicomponent Na+:H+ antiporter subunit B
VPASEHARRTEPHEEEPRHRPWLAALLVAGMAALLAAGLAGLPREGAPLPAVARYALQIALPLWHTTEPVNEIVYGTRGFDTFGETFLLLAAVVSVAMVARRREPRRGFIGEERAGRREQAETDPRDVALDRQEVESRRAEQAEQDESPGLATPDHTQVGRPAPENAEAMTVVVRTGARIAGLLLAVAGLYLVAWGYSPGGGFPGGAVILGVVLLLYAGFGHRRLDPMVRPSRVESAELLGAVAIILTGLLGLVRKGSFLASWLPLGAPQSIRSGGILQVFSGSELVEVGTGLTLAVFGLLAMRHDWAPDAAPDGHSSEPTEHTDRGRREEPR